MVHPQYPDLDGAPLPVLRELLDSADFQERADAATALGDRLRTHELKGVDADVHDNSVVDLDDIFSCMDVDLDADLQGRPW